MTQQAQHFDDETLSALLDNQLSAAEMELARAHLATCSECEERLDDLREVQSLLRGLPEVEPSRDFSLGLRLLVDPPNVVRLKRWYTATRIGAAACAAGFVFLSASALYVDSLPTAQFASSPSVASAPAAPTLNAPPAAPAVRSAAAPASGASPAPPPGAQGAAAASRPASGPKPQADDQQAAATNVSPLPTSVPTPIAAPTPIALRPVAQEGTAAPDAAAPLRNGAIATGVLAVTALLGAIIFRHRLSAQTPSNL